MSWVWVGNYIIVRDGGVTGFDIRRTFSHKQCEEEN